MTSRDGCSSGEIVKIDLELFEYPMHDNEPSVSQWAEMARPYDVHGFRTTRSDPNFTTQPLYHIGVP